MSWIGFIVDEDSKLSIEFDGECTDDVVFLLETSSGSDKKVGPDFSSRSVGNGSPGEISNAPKFDIISNILMKSIYLE